MKVSGKGHDECQMVDWGPCQLVELRLWASRGAFCRSEGSPKPGWRTYRLQCSDVTDRNSILAHDRGGVGN